MSSLLAHHDELRDPTREELYNGPKREKLPETIQQMTTDETACTFCGVSYFVFSEVQELQATVKKYKKTFHDFVRFMERERKISQEIKAEVLTLNKSFSQLAATFSTTAIQVTQDNKQLRHQNGEATIQLGIAQRELRTVQTEHSQLQIQFKRAEEEYKLAGAMTEQRLRNEILHLSSQIEKCKLLTVTQEANFATDLEKERTQIRELEVLLATTRASLSSAERQLVTERDQLKQLLQAATERVELEREGAKQLELQLRAVQVELSRVVCSNESERAGFTQLQSEITTLKAQILQHEKARVSVTQELSDRTVELNVANTAMRSLRIQVATLESKIQENAIHIEQLKQEFGKDLETLRQEHGTMVTRLQREHQKTMDELKQSQHKYIEHLKSQTAEKLQNEASTTQQALLVMEGKLAEAEKQVIHWKVQSEQQAYEMQQSLSTQEKIKAQADKLEKTINVLEREKIQLQDETTTLTHQLDRHKNHAKQQLEKLMKEVATQEQLLTTQKTEFQQRINALQAQCDQLQQDNQGLKARVKANVTLGIGFHAPQQAWGDDADDTSRGSRSSGVKRGSTSSTPTPTHSINQDHHELEKIVVTLRHTIHQKDKEIVLLQQTVHRECMERTSLLEKMRNGKVLPDVGPHSTPSTTAATRKSITTNHTDDDEGRGEESGNDGDDPSAANDGSQPKASFYERLRRAGQRKPKSVRK